MKVRQERDLAALAHLFNAVPGWGLIACGAIWFHARERSRWLAAQALQAMMFHGLLLVVAVVGMVVEKFRQIVGVIVPPFGSILGLLNNVALGAMLFVYVGYCVLGAWRCFGGHAHRYPLIGQRSQS